MASHFNRRALLSRTAAIAASAFALSPPRAVAQTQQQGSGFQPSRFTGDVVKQRARALSEAAFARPDTKLPEPFARIGYDEYRSVRFKPDGALWRGENLPFEVQFFHRGFLYVDRVDIFEVVDGDAREIRYTPGLFDFGGVTPPPPDANLGFAGFRLHAPINRHDYYDEVAVFLGASYFRAVAKGQTYGLSARGLSIKTADAKGEEFPAFRAFWIEKPAKGADAIVVHALLDSNSAAAAYRFTIRPGETTVFDVEVTLFPRVDIDQVGIGTLTSMFLFDVNDRRGVDDFRGAVHDSDGLAIRNGNGEEIWRPLRNPNDLQVSVFANDSTPGFGLIQRLRDFHGYEDLESRFETRPSAWVEMIGDSRKGAVHLIEIPTKEEYHDNIVAFWRPAEALKAKQAATLSHRIHWGAGKIGTPPLAAFARTRVGAAANNRRHFVLDLIGGDLQAADAATIRAHVAADKGEVQNVVAQRNSVTNGWRISFEFDAKKAPVAELRAQLMQGDKAVSEVWLYRWTP